MAGDVDASIADLAKGHQAANEKDSLCDYKLRVLQADAFIWKKRGKESLTLLEQEPPEPLAETEPGVQRKITQSYALSSEGKFDESRIRLQEAERIAAKQRLRMHGELSLATGTLLLRQTKSKSANQSKWNEIRAYFLQALKFLDPERQRLLRAAALGNLGFIATNLEHYDEARDWYTKAADLHVAISEPITLIDLGWNYEELGDFERAIPLFTQAKDISTTDFLKQLALINLGVIYISLENYNSATDYFFQALTFAKRLNDQEQMAICYNNLALVALADHRLQEAESYNTQAMDIKKAGGDHNSWLQSVLTTAKLYDEKHQFATAEPLLRQVIADTRAQQALQWEAEAELARVYVGENQSISAKKQFEKVLHDLDNALGTVSDLDHKLAFASLAADFYSDYIQFLISQHQPVEALQVAEQIRGRTLREGLHLKKSEIPESIQAAAIGKFLRNSNQIILSYWLGREASYLWAISSKGIKTFPLPARRDIDLQVEEYRKFLMGSLDQSRGKNAGRELYKLLVQPAQQLIQPQAHVVVIADGSLTKLNFETLLEPGDATRYWIEDVEIQNASSIALLTRSHPSRIAGDEKLLLIGNPVQASPDFPELKHGEEEMDRVAKHFPPAARKVLDRNDATPSGYGRSMPAQFGFIHFVTHGTASQVSPLDSAIILSPNSDENFKLYARDIVKTQIHAEVVTISACSGAGKRAYSAEGLVGLAWAFMRAGAHQVVAGLWEIDDRSTPDFMDDFYGELKQTRNAAEALRTAKLHMLHSQGVYQRPYYWGSLQLYTGL
jgi:CHAT domain-containing protein